MDVSSMVPSRRWRAKVGAVREKDPQSLVLEYSREERGVSPREEEGRISSIPLTVARGAGPVASVRRWSTRSEQPLSTRGRASC